MEEQYRTLPETQQYLIDLLRAYGNRLITVKVSEDGPVKVMARTFVRRQLGNVGIEFPHNEGNKSSLRPLNFSLNNDQISVLFHEALFDFEEAYVYERCASSRADGFANMIFDWIDRKNEWLYSTFPDCFNEDIDPFPEAPTKVIDPQDTEAIESAKQVLKEFGVEKIDGIADINAIFWNLAFHHKPITKAMRSAIIELSTNQTLTKKILAANSKFFNTQIEKMSGTFIDEESQQEIKALREQIVTLNGTIKNYKHNTETARQSRATHRRFSKLVLTQIENPHSGFYKSYNMENEEDQEHYLLWFKILQKKVTNQLVKNIEKHWEYSAEALDNFKSKVEQYNATLINSKDTDEEQD